MTYKFSKDLFATIFKILEKKADKSEYQKFFKSVLKKFEVSSPSELDTNKKKEFFDYIEKHWDGKNEDINYESDEDETIDEKHMTSAQKRKAKKYRKKNKRKLKKYAAKRNKKIKNGSLRVNKSKSRKMKKARAKSGISDSFTDYDELVFAEDIDKIERCIDMGIDVDIAIDAAIKNIDVSSS